MNYNHAYHAGNFADVLKHIVLIGLFDALLRKDKPFCYLDTHAGRGYYDLSKMAQKTQEYEEGILKILAEDNPPLLVKKYLHAVRELNQELAGSNQSPLKFYPGSPLLAQRFKRESDSLIACELHPETFQFLKSSMTGITQVAIHHIDGYLGLKAYLPPKERRGLILIDPPYENRDEFKNIIAALKIALKRFDHGIYMVWYPIKDPYQVLYFKKQLQTLDQTILMIDFTIHPPIAQFLKGCGLAIINPPYGFQQTINQLLPWLWNALTINHQGGYSTYLLNSAVK
ncbi:MAG: 23S rRNA (adenine(2030)-N(6))-methyltransferase RlmJ [Gammaproteobacteria bacterium]|nr:23S rRNA (adenine(2030)-N(6))-methyltransferase RlmJ [Gammaproteobacteria bacterium]